MMRLIASDRVAASYMLPRIADVIVFAPGLRTPRIVMPVSSSPSGVVQRWPGWMITCGGVAGSSATTYGSGPRRIATSPRPSRTGSPASGTIDAAPRTTADGQAIYSAPDTQRVTIAAGATGAATVTYAPFELTYQTVVSGLTSPTFLTAPAGDARLFVVEQGGRVMEVLDGQKLDTPFLDIARDVRSGGEQGLLSMAFAPDYATSGRFYVYFTAPRAGDSTGSVIRWNTTAPAKNSSPRFMSITPMPPWKMKPIRNSGLGQ